MTTEQIDPDAGNVDDKDQTTPTSQGQAEQAVPANSETKDSDFREDLVKQLMQESVKEEPEEAAEQIETEDVDEIDAEDGVDDTPTPDEPTKPEAELSSVDTDKRLAERTRKRIGQLREKAAFGELITKTLVDGNVTPDEFSRWTNLSARLKKGDPTAVTELIATAKAFGYKEPITKEAPQVKTVDDVANDIYREDFESEVSDLNISEPLARKQARKLAEMRVKATPVEAPPERTQPQVDNQTRPMNPIRDHAIRTIDNLEKDYRSKVKDYAKIEQKVAQRLVAEYKNQDPISWVGGFENIVREEIRSMNPVQTKAPVKAVAGTQVRPTSSVASAGDKADNPRDDLVKSIMRGDFSRS